MNHDDDYSQTELGEFGPWHFHTFTFTLSQFNFHTFTILRRSWASLDRGSGQTLFCFGFQLSPQAPTLWFPSPKLVCLICCVTSKGSPQIRFLAILGILSQPDILSTLFFHEKVSPKILFEGSKVQTLP